MGQPPSDKRPARIAGLLYLFMAVCSAFSMMYVDGKLYVPGQAAATVVNILTEEGLFRLGLVSNLVGQVAFLFLVHALYKLLRAVDENQARLMVILVVVSVPLTCLNMLNQVASLLLLNSDGYLRIFAPAQREALAMLFLDIHQQGLYIAEIFWGLWLFPFGVLVFRSGFFPRAFGVVLGLGGLGYLIEAAVMFLFPAFKTLATGAVAVSGLAELSFILWLLIKGSASAPAPAYAVGAPTAGST